MGGALVSCVLCLYTTYFRTTTVGGKERWGRGTGGAAEALIRVSGLGSACLCVAVGARESAKENEKTTREEKRGEGRV